MLWLRSREGYGGWGDRTGHPTWSKPGGCGQNPLVGDGVAFTRSQRGARLHEQSV